MHVTISSACGLMGSSSLLACRPHWRSARTWPPDETLQQTLYLAEPAAHVEDAVNSIRVARKRSSPGPEAARQQVWGLLLGYWHAMLCVRAQQPPSAVLTEKITSAYAFHRTARTDLLVLHIARGTAWHRELCARSSIASAVLVAKGCSMASAACCQYRQAIACQADETPHEIDPKAHGSLRIVAPGHASRWRHDVSTSSSLKVHPMSTLPAMYTH